MRRPLRRPEEPGPADRKPGERSTRRSRCWGCSLARCPPLGRVQCIAFHDVVLNCAMGLGGVLCTWVLELNAGICPPAPCVDQPWGRPNVGHGSLRRTPLGRQGARRFGGRRLASVIGCARSPRLSRAKREPVLRPCEATNRMVCNREPFNARTNALHCLAHKGLAAVSAVWPCEIGMPPRERRSRGRAMNAGWPGQLWIVRHGESAGNVARDAAESGGLARHRSGLARHRRSVVGLGRPAIHGLGRVVRRAASRRPAGGRPVLALRARAPNRRASWPQCSRMSSAVATLRLRRAPARKGVRHPRPPDPLGIRAEVSRAERATPACRQVLLPPAGRRELVRRDPAPAQLARDDDARIRAASACSSSRTR